MEENQDSTQVKEIDKISHFDPMLWMFSSIVVKNGISFDITLNVKGVIICGTLIAQEQYFKEVNQQLIGSENGEMFGKIVSQIGEYQEKESKFIHLKNAKYLIGDNQIPSNEGVCWRGRLTEIDGFHLGSFSTST